MSRFAPNVGPLDAGIRFVLGVAILVGALWAARASDADWALTLLIHPSILAVYLLLTAAARNDVAYHVFGWSTADARPSRGERRRMRLDPPRGERPL